MPNVHVRRRLDTCNPFSRFISPPPIPLLPPYALSGYLPRRAGFHSLEHRVGREGSGEIRGGDRRVCGEVEGCTTYSLA